MPDYLVYLSTYNDWAPLILRLGLGIPFIFHGYPKLFVNRAGVAGWFESIGIRPGKFWAVVVGVVEFFGGIALVLGLWVPLTALLITVNMLVAMVKVKWGKSKFVDASGGMGWELDFAYLAMAVALVLLGAGRYALGG